MQEEDREITKNINFQIEYIIKRCRPVSVATRSNNGYEYWH